MCFPGLKCWTVQVFPTSSPWSLDMLSFAHRNQCYPPLPLWHPPHHHHQTLRTVRGEQTWCMAFLLKGQKDKREKKTLRKCYPTHRGIQSCEKAEKIHGSVAGTDTAENWLIKTNLLRVLTKNFKVHTGRVLKYNITGCAGDVPRVREIHRGDGQYTGYVNLSNGSADLFVFHLLVKDTDGQKTIPQEDCNILLLEGWRARAKWSTYCTTYVQ